MQRSTVSSHQYDLGWFSFWKQTSWATFSIFSRQDRPCVYRLSFTSFLSYLVRQCLTICNICLVVTKKKKMKKTTKNNDENDQISTIIGIFRQILEKPSLAKYIEVYISRKTILSAFYYFFSYYLLFCILLKLLHFSL